MARRRTASRARRRAPTVWAFGRSARTAAPSPASASGHRPSGWNPVAESSPSTRRGRGVYARGRGELGRSASVRAALLWRGMWPAPRGWRKRLLAPGQITREKRLRSGQPTASSSSSSSLPRERGRLRGLSTPRREGAGASARTSSASLSPASSLPPSLRRDRPGEYRRIEPVAGIVVILAALFIAFAAAAARLVARGAGERDCRRFRIPRLRRARVSPLRFSSGRAGCHHRPAFLGALSAAGSSRRRTSCHAVRDRTRPRNNPGRRQASRSLGRRPRGSSFWVRLSANTRK